MAHTRHLKRRNNSQPPLLFFHRRSFYNLVASALGENLIIPPALTQLPWSFAIVNGATMLVCFAAFAAILYSLRHKKLI